LKLMSPPRLRLRRKFIPSMRPTLHLAA